MKYEINCNTIALIPINNEETKVLENDNVLNIKSGAFDIVKNSCEYFGSTYLGRHEGTKNMIGVSYKAPIIVEESRNMIYFPTTSPRLSTCMWFNLNSIKTYINKGNNIIIYFKNNRCLKVNISYGSFDNQYLRAVKLESVLRKRILGSK